VRRDIKPKLLPSELQQGDGKWAVFDTFAQRFCSTAATKASADSRTRTMNQRYESR
jgi:hypothetical protein